jgi:hypothetical protein
MASAPGQTLFPSSRAACSRPDQRLVEDGIGDAEVLFLDNRSTLVYGGRENDAESWDNMQQWFIRLRRAGKTVVLFDHASRSGSSRGTSKREDVLDTVIHLKRPDDYEEEEGARFEVHLQKAHRQGDRCRAWYRQEYGQPHPGQGTG